MSFEGSIRTNFWKNRRVTVMGLGRFGGGIAVTRFLVQRGAVVTLTDTASETELADSLNALVPYRPARLVLGRHEEQDFRNVDCIVVNPAVKPNHPLLQIAMAAGVPLTSEMSLFWALQRGRIVAVTGSNGKSTTAAMIHAILREAGIPVRLGGNIGHSLLEEVEDIQETDWSVLELSSFQLTALDRMLARPDVAVVTNFSPNHLDWHGTLENYRDAKQVLLRYQTPRDVAVLNADDPEVSTWPTSARQLNFGEHAGHRDGVFAASPGSTEWHLRIGSFTETIPLGDWLRVPGRHNQQNAAAALAAALSAGATLPAAKSALQHFAGLPHRLQFITETAGRRFYNDSIATTPESVAMALDAFTQPIILLAGGSDKGTDLSAFAAQLSQRAKAIALMGETGPRIDQHLKQQKPSTAKAQVCRTFAETLTWAMQQSAPGDVILLSPGCASYDWFRNFADRGEQFTQFAKSWQPAENTFPSPEH